MEKLEEAYAGRPHLGRSPPPAMLSPPLGVHSGQEVGRRILQEMLNGPG